MKKVILVFVGIAVAGISAYTAHRANSAKDWAEDLLLENAEALAEYESEEHVRCLGVGSVDCPRYHVKVDWVMSGYSLE